MRVCQWVLFVFVACVAVIAANTAHALNAEDTLVKILAADDTPEDPNLFEPDGDGIVDRAHFRLLDRVLEDDTTPRHAEILALWSANRAQVADDNTLTFECILLERLLGLTCDDFEVYGASQITIGDPTGNARIQRLLDTVGIEVGLENYDISAAIWLAADGDLDGDGFSNREEYDAVCADFDAFVEAAINPLVTPETVFCCGLCPLEFDELPADADKYVGEALTLTVSVVNAEDTPQYAWLKDGDPTGITTQTLNIATLSLADAGDYQCTVTDGTETITTPVAVVLVANKMQFTQQPQGAQLYRGEPLSMQVAVNGGLTPLTYLWTRGNTVVGGNSPSFSLPGPSVTLGAAGTYTCTVTDARESIRSNPATVVVAERMTATAQPASQTLLVGSNATFSFSVQNGLGTLAYQWLHNGDPVGGNAPTLTVPGVAFADAGSYQCIATDAREALPSRIATLTVVDALTITRQPEGARKLVGTSHTFSIATAGGLPPVSYRWFKDNAALNATGTSLALNALSLDNAGTYWCVVRDEEDNTESTRVALEVFAPLRITTQPEGASKLIGSPHTLNVTIADGGGDETYRWFKDEQPLDATTNTLDFPALALDDNGQYFCEITDEFTTIRSEVAVINVAENILITQQPLGAAKYTGDAHTFTIAAAGGLNTLTYRWLKDGGPTGETSDTLTIAPLNPGDTGSYQCEVNDGAETARSSVALLQVADHIEITTQPQGARLLTGEPLTLSVQSTGGLGTITYRWLRGEEVVSTGTPQYTINEVELDDAGTYRCEISDDFETTVSDTAAVAVAEPLRFTLDPVSAVRNIGEAITFQAAVEGGLGDVSLAWYRDDALLEVTGPTLSISVLTKADAGDYVCLATDERGTISSGVASLSIITPLLLDQPLAGITTLAGADAALSVAVSGGDAPLTYTWFRSEDVLQNTGPVLVFSPLRPEDAGEYSVRISDGFQEVESNTVTVTVLPRLRITVDPLSAQVILGQSAHFEVAATGGLGDYHYAWFHDGKPVSGAGPRLELNRIDFDDAGAYTCAISDDFDTVFTAPATLNVLPKPAGILNTTPADGTTIDLGSTPLGQAIERTVLLQNTGNAPLGFALSAAGDSQFSALAITGAPTLEPGAQINATVTFQPIVPGTFAAELRIFSDGTLQSTIQLRGTATAKGFWACGSTPATSNTLGIGDLTLCLFTLTGLLLIRRPLGNERPART